MSTAPDSVMELTRYSESSSMNAALYRADQRKARKPERRGSSFLDTIVGHRGSLRSILNQLEAVAGAKTTVLITGETAPARKSLRKRFTSSAPVETQIWSR